VLAFLDAIVPVVPRREIGDHLTRWLLERRRPPDTATSPD